MSDDQKKDHFDQHRDAEGRVLRRWGHLDVTDEQRDAVQQRMEAWRLFNETGDTSLLLKLGILPPPAGQRPSE